jgi:hypothetical protein
LKIRLNRNELAIIRNKAKKCGMSNARFTRESALNKNIKAKPIRNEEEKQALRKLTGMDNNLNQIAKRINAGEQLNELLLKTISEIRQIIKQLI